MIACDKKRNLLKILDEKELHIEFSKEQKLPDLIKKLCIKKTNKKIILKFKKSEISTAEIIKMLVEKK